MLNKIYEAIIDGSENHVIYTDVPLKDVVADIPKVEDELILYIEDFGLPERKYLEKTHSRILKTLCDDYLHLTIFERVIAASQSVDVSKISDIVIKDVKVNSKEELLRLIRKSKSHIMNAYFKEIPEIDNTKIPVVLTIPFDIRYLKEACNIKKITVIFDNVTDICNESKMAVNNILSYESSKYVTCILSTSKKNWLEYRTTNNCCIIEGVDYILIDGEESKKVYGK